MTTDATSATPTAAASVRAGAVPSSSKSQPGSVQGKATAAASGDTVQLSPEAAASVAKLKARDADVRAHEAAHVAAGGSLITGGPTYSYERGPDGKQYAVGGDVSIDTSAVPGDPQATLAKARQISASAMAPADPSGQDETVAGQAQAMAASAQAQVDAGGGSGGKAKVGALVDVTG
ncbi:MAG: putative metalloprotease CJM1_0395 family protein [Holophaga sp.]|nr:putative metalloprotease CJM1_0395 family protein [Holophaga sp.]